MENLKVFACSDSAEKFTEEVCDYLKIEKGSIKRMKFKNDNNFVQILESVRDKDIFLIQTTEPPVNERIMELLITIDAVKRASAKRITVVLPYYMYSRSDKKDQPRIPVTAKLLAQLIEAAGANRVLTCDLHNKAIEHFNCPIALVDKRREGNDDRAIATSVIGNIKGKNALIFDDEVDTAGSIMETVEVCKKFGAKDVYVGCTHGVLSGPAIERLSKSNIKDFVMTNTIPLPKEKQIEKISVISISELFGEAIRRIHTETSIGELFDTN